MTKMQIATFTMTSPPVTRADSRMPRTATRVSTMTMKAAPRLTVDCSPKNAVGRWSRLPM
jgi:hypothetical protein